MKTQNHPMTLFYTPRAFHEDLKKMAKDRKISLVKIHKKNFPNEKGLDNHLKVYLVDIAYLKEFGKLFKKFYLNIDDPFHQLILVTENQKEIDSAIPSKYISNIFSLPISGANIEIYQSIINRAFESLQREIQCFVIQKQLLNRTQLLREVTQIGIALNTERDLDKLLSLILGSAKGVSLADSGSLYLVEKDPNRKDAKRLRFKISSMDIEDKEFTIPIDNNSVAGHVAYTGNIVNLKDAYFPPPNSNFSINKSFDIETGYRTKSMVVLPMKNQKDEVIGVLQLINCRTSKTLVLKDPKHIEEVVIPFDENNIEVLSSFAGQAAVSIENSNLYKSIHDLFEGFVTAAVTAIESRDPTTSGHSSRVAKFTMSLAEALNRTSRGIYGLVNFSSNQIREIRYASLLHDFGKVGVREEVLVKAKKLYPFNLQMIKDRFQFIKKTIQNEVSHKKINYILQENRQATLEDLKIFDIEEAKRLAEIDQYLQIILESNEPSVLETEGAMKILEIARLQYQDFDKNVHNFLLDNEIKFLSIRKGSLNDVERLEIESHVTHTFKFLSQIPWTTELKDIPSIAYAHHEKLSGTGYPKNLKTKEIPIQSKMMTISDIFDALTAADRPYKKAVPVEKALDILGYEVKDNQIDPDLFNIFIEAKIFNLISKDNS